MNVFILAHTSTNYCCIIVKWLPHVYSNHFRLSFYGLQINILCICGWFRILYSLAAAPDMEWTTRPANFCCFCTQCQHLRGVVSLRIKKLQVCKWCCVPDFMLAFSWVLLVGLESWALACNTALLRIYMGSRGITKFLIKLVVKKASQRSQGCFCSAPSTWFLQEFSHPSSWLDQGEFLNHQTQNV